MKDNNLYLLEYISAIEQNYPPENYTMLREALDYCLKILKEKISESLE
jgi:hypothetical protein